MTDNLRRALEDQKRLTSQEPYRITGILGMPLGGQLIVEVPNRNAYVFVRLRSNQSEVIQAYNNQVSPSYNLPVVVERHGNKYIVAGVDNTRYENNWNSFAPFLPRHGNAHSFDWESGGGGDIVWVYPRQFMPLLVLPSGSVGGPNVIVSSYVLKTDSGSWKYVGNTGTQDITPYRPVTGAIMGLVYLNTNDGNPYLLIGSGTVFSNTITGSSQITPYIPSITNPSTQIPLAAIRLVTGTSQISWNNIYDVRQFLHNVPTGTGGGGGGSVNTGTLDARYLKLDTSNDPLYNALQISGSIRMVKDAMVGTSQADNTPLMIESHVLDAPAMDIEQYATTGAIVDTGVLFLYRSNLNEESNPRFIRPVIDVWEDSISGSFYGGVLRDVIDGTSRLDLNPHATGTVFNYLFDTDKARPTGTIHTAFRVSGTQIAYLDVSGTFHSNGTPLVKEAPVNGLVYVRKNAGWESVGLNGTSTLSANIDLTGTVAAWQDVNVSITLPGAGTYKLTADVRAAVQGNGGSFWWISARLYNTTAGAEISQSERIVVFGNLNTLQLQNTASINEIVTVAGATSIKLQATRDGIGPPTYTTSYVGSDTNGRTKLMYEKIG